MSTSRTVSVSSKVEDKDGEGERERETFAQTSETFAQTSETSAVGVGGEGVKEWVQMGGGRVEARILELSSTTLVAPDKAEVCRVC